MEQISPLCVRIKNAFSSEDIKTIHSTFQLGTQPMIDIQPHAKIKCEFDHCYIDCIALGSFTIYNDDSKQNGVDKAELIQLRICESEYSKLHHIANIECFVPLDRIDADHLRLNHSKILCKTVRQLLPICLLQKVHCILLSL